MNSAYFLICSSGGTLGFQKNCTVCFVLFVCLFYHAWIFPPLLLLLLLCFFLDFVLFLLGLGRYCQVQVQDQDALYLKSTNNIKVFKHI